MKLIMALALTLLFLAPCVALAGGDDTFQELTTIIDDDPDFDAPIPEPTSAVLMGVGLAIVGVAWRIRR